MEQKYTVQDKTKKNPNQTTQQKNPTKKQPPNPTKNPL